MMKNGVSDWYNRHEVITKLIDEFDYTKLDLALILCKDNTDIQFYLNPPKKVESETIRQGKEKIINKISLEAFKHDYNKDYLYNLILRLGKNITLDQLKYIGWMRGNGIKFEERYLTPHQEQQLIEKALHVKEDFLSQIRVTINDMRLSNGDDPINFKI